MNIHSLPPVHVISIPDAESLNRSILQRFWILRDDPNTRRSHFFHGRFENIYIPRGQMPEILPLITLAEQAASTILQRTEPLRSGHWFNWMGPGHCTSLHTHEEDDELLSAVYYLTVPEHSGDLLLESAPFSIRLHPAPGMLALFPPSLPHAVECNKSDQHRLSVAFNFGPL
jgi:hypothetical protein